MGLGKEILFYSRIDLGDEEKAIVEAVRASRVAGAPMPTPAQLAAAIGQTYTGNIQALIDSIRAKGRIHRVDFFEPPAQQKILPFLTPHQDIAPRRGRYEARGSV